MKSFCVLNMLPSAAVSENIGAAVSSVLGSKVGFMSNMTSAAKQLEAAAARGVQAAGGCAFMLGEGFEAQLRTLISYYSLDAGVYIGGKAGCLVSVYGSDGKPLDNLTEQKISELAAKGVTECDGGNVIEVNGLQAYERTITAEQLSLENTAFCVKSTNVSVEKNARKMQFAFGGGTAKRPVISISSSGLFISAVDEEGNTHTHGELLAVCCACMLWEKQPVSVGFDAPVCLEELAGSRGVNLSRSFAGGSELWQNDGLFLTARLCSFMSRRGVGLAELCRTVPDVAVRRRTLAVNADLSAIADMVDCDEVIVEEGRGVFTRIGKGSAVLTPCRVSGKYSLEVQAAASETAQELCDGFEKAIKS